MIRPLALGRKNYLFAGSHESARRIAMSKRPSNYTSAPPFSSVGVAGA